MNTFNRSITPKEVKNIIGSGDFMLDIGANDGTDTFSYLSIMPRLTVYAFEPEPTAVEKFKSMNTFNGRCRLFETAVGATVDRVRFERSSISDAVERWNQSGSICKPTGHLRKHPWCEFKYHIAVDCVTLDSWSKQHIGCSIIPFIKADVQGAEHLLIKGGMETFRRTRFFYTEYDNEELYEGQPTLATIETQLPWFKKVAIFDNNVLLQNTVLNIG